MSLVFSHKLSSTTEQVHISFKISHTTKQRHARIKYKYRVGSGYLAQEQHA